MKVAVMRVNKENFMDYKYCPKVRSFKGTPAPAGDAPGNECPKTNALQVALNHHFPFTKLTR